MNIVTIDFDIFTCGIDEENHIVDLELYRKFSDYVFKVIDKLPVDKIFFIENHENILQYLPKDENNCIINIDHHHDIYYGDKEEAHVLNCGNWGYKAFKDKMVSNFIWIKNKNSMDNQLTDYILDEKDFLQKINGIDIDFLNFQNLYNNTDMLVICLSINWVGEKNQPLYEIWQDYYLSKKERLFK